MGTPDFAAHFDFNKQVFVTTEANRIYGPERINEAMLRWMNNHGAQGIITTDDQLKIRGWNHWLEVRTGKKATAMLGCNLLEAFPELKERRLDHYYRRALEGQSGVLSQKFHRFLLEMITSGPNNNEPMNQSVRISPLVEKGVVIGTVTVIDDVTERVKREAALQHQLEQHSQLLAAESAARNATEAASRRLRNLQMITDETLAQMSLEDLLASSVRSIRGVLGVETAAILLVDLNGDLVVRATDGIQTDIIGVCVPGDTEFSGIISSEAVSQIVEQELRPNPFMRVVEQAGVRSLSGVPLMVSKRVLGVLCIGDTTTQAISADDLRFLSLVADRVAIAIERIRLYNAERHARAQAEEANQLKDQFLATVSHELRTPLNAILGWARMLNSGRIDEKTSSHALEVIERNARSQAQLIDDLLDVSRIISGKLRLNISQVEPVSILELALDAVRPAADAKEIELQTKLSADLGTIPGDPDRIQQIIWNLISNAIKFTANGGKVLIEVERQRSHMEFKITDTGQGIHPKFLPFVFDRFRQADATVARSHGGLGLGLAIVRHLTELHGGTVEAKSDGEGHGASFIVRLPIQLATIDNEIADDFIVMDSESAGRRFECQPVLEGLRVLVVDDEPDALDLIKTVLAECGADTYTAGSAAEGFAFVMSDPPDILISDIEMPVEDGYSFIRKVRSLAVDKADKILAVALTAHANKEDRIRAMSAGFQVHVRKPVEPTELIAAISRLLNGPNH